MTEEENADELPPTVAAEHPETTFVPPVGDPAPDLAWSLGDDADTVLFHRHSWDSAWGRALLVVGCAIAIALFISIAGVIAMLAHRDSRSSASAPERETVVVQTSLVAPPAPPSTTTVTVEAAPTTVTLTPTPTTVTVRVPVTPAAPTRSPRGLPPSRVDSANDQQFLDRMRSLGYTITDPQLALRNAHETCRLFQSGESSEQVNQQMSAKMGTSMSETLELTSSAILSYPDCFRRTSHAYGDASGDGD